MLTKEHQIRIKNYLFNNLNFIKEGNYFEALNNCKKVLEIDAENFDANYFIGAINLKLKNYLEAIKYIKNAIKINPKNSGLYNNFGVALYNLEFFDEAVKNFKKAISLKKNFFEAYNNCGNALKKLERYEESITFFNIAISLNNNYAEAYNNLCGSFIDLYQYENALEAINKAIEINNKYADAFFNKGLIYEIKKDYKEAFNQYCTAININPNHIESLKHRSFIFEEANQFKNSLADLNKIISIAPEENFMLGRILNLKMKINCWDSSYFETIKKIEKKIIENKKIIHPFYTLLFANSPSLQKKCAEIYVKNSKQQKNDLLFIKKSKINVAYFSSDFGHHAVSSLITGLIEMHNKNKFKIFGFSLKKRNYKLPVENQIDQQYLERLIPAFDQYYDIESINNLDIYNMCKKNKIDIAIDLNGHTTHARTALFLKRIAPIQINFLGYPGTMGSEMYDYIVADNKLILENEKNFYSEKIIYMPNSYQPNDYKREKLNLSMRREDYGLKKENFVFCCLNGNQKITPQIYTIWMRILKSAENSVLWLLESNKEAMQNIIKETNKMNINKDRIIFAKKVPRSEHISRFQLADLFLDTSPYGGHTTISEALYAGLPVITYSGKTFASRVGASLLNALEMSELITYSLEDYEKLAIKIWREDKIKILRNKLNNNIKSKYLFNTEIYARNIEKAFEIIFKRNYSKQKPDHIYI